jgi:hypothetical protein
VPTTAPVLMDARAAARALETAIKDPRTPHTVADAAAESGLPLRDAERGMHELTSEYRGHLRVTDKGDLLYVFPNGFTKPWQTRDAFDRAFERFGKAFVGVGRFVVRAWLMIVLLAYAAIFLAVIIGAAFTRQGNDNRRGGGMGGEIGLVLFRVLGDALFWTFHPFSPFYVGYGGYGAYDSNAYGRQRSRSRDKTPFYEKVNRFFFGPTPPAEEPNDMAKRVLAQIRASEGRIGLADVMRVTGLPRDEADPLMARLMLDYDGDVQVSEEGGITYTFAAIRKTALDGASATAPGAAWDRKKELLPLTGNDGSSNLLVAGLNVFNGLMAFWAIGADLTINKLPFIFGKIPIAMLPWTGTPIVLGIIPLVMSAALFLLPLGRALMRPAKARKVERENARLAVLRTILSRVKAHEPVTDSALVAAWKQATGHEPESKELTREVVALGGDVDLDKSGEEVRYRFVDLETEAQALDEERAEASDEEKRVGKVEFASDN